MEDGEWRMENGDLQVRNRRHAVKTSPRMAHFFTSGGEKVRGSILREWALRHSRKGCHVTIHRPRRMGGKRV
jgi:hypothetical protein